LYLLEAGDLGLEHLLGFFLGVSSKAATFGLVKLFLILGLESRCDSLIIDETRFLLSKISLIVLHAANESFAELKELWDVAPLPLRKGLRSVQKRRSVVKLLLGFVDLLVDKVGCHRLHLLSISRPRLLRILRLHVEQSELRPLFFDFGHLLGGKLSEHSQFAME